jgi:hypothetical protein
MHGACVAEKHSIIETQNKHVALTTTKKSPELWFANTNHSVPCGRIFLAFIGLFKPSLHTQDFKDICLMHIHFVCRQIAMEVFIFRKYSLFILVV